MGRLWDTAKHLIIGRALPGRELSGALLPKRLALPVFASDPLSSVAYATQEILLVLSVAGVARLYLAGWIGAGVVLLLAVVVLSYRQVVRAYPSGGGSYEVVTTNLGPSTGLVVAASLLVDYVMTVAVSVASGVANLASVFPVLNGHRVEAAVGFVAVLTIVNLRGVRESGRAFAPPTYLFITMVLVMCVIGLIRWAVGDPPVAESARYGIVPEAGASSLGGMALLLLVLRAFSSGCTALTGVEAISNGVPAFREPKGRNAAFTLTVMGLIAALMFSGVTALALLADVHITEDTCRLTGVSGNCAGVSQPTVIAQLGAAVFGGPHSVGFLLLQAVTALVLILAANTAFNGLPLLASNLAGHRCLPRQFAERGDRLVFSNGILALAAVAAVLLWVYDASVTNLIHLYILGVFTSFTLSQTGMIRHWTRLLRTERDPAVRRRHRTARVVNAVGAAVTGVVLVIVLVTKFTEGAYLAVIAGVLLWFTMRGIRRHYDRAAAALAAPDPVAEAVPPARLHAVVVVSGVDKPTLRALACARACHPGTLEALAVAVDPVEAAALRERWEGTGIDVPLTMLESPYRELSRPIVGHVRAARRAGPRDVVAVFLAEFAVGHWWEDILHNRSALWLRSRLAATPGVIVVSVPWQLPSSRRPRRGHARRAPGAVRRGEPVPPSVVRGDRR